MMKKLFSCCLSVVAFCGISSSAFAAGAEVHGVIQSSFGQYDSGEDSSSSHLRNTHLGAIVFNAKSGKFLGQAEFDFITPGSTSDASTIAPTPVNVSYLHNDQLTLIAGRKAVTAAKPFSRGGGVDDPCNDTVYQESDHYTHINGYGFFGSYKFKDSSTRINLGALSQELIKNTAASDNGYGYHVSIEGAFNPIEYRLAYTSGTEDDFDDPDDDEISSSATMLSVKYSMNEDLSISVSYHTKTVDETEFTMGDMQFIGKHLGPGDVLLTYASQEEEDADTDTWLNLVYSIDVGDPSGAIKLMYMTKNTDPQSGDSVTKQFTGVAFVKFF